MNDSIEAAIAAKGLTAPRVTPADIQACIKSEFYFTAADGVMGESELGTRPAGRAESLNRLTFCVLVLDNGFTVTGESACASPANFDPEVGRLAARRNAENKIWPLLGFRLRDQLAVGVVGEVVATNPPAATPLPVVNFRNGLFQIQASIEEFGPDEWLQCNLQLRSDWPKHLFPMSEIEQARVYRNTYCNADGSLVGTSTPPLQFPQAGTPAEAELLSRCNGTTFAFDVRTARGMPPYGQFIQDRARPLGPLLGIKGNGRDAPVHALRAKEWADIEPWIRRAGAARRLVGQR